MATGTTVELDIELQRRLERIAEARHESAGKVIGDAIQEFVSRLERLQSLGLMSTSSPEFKAEYRRQREVIAAHYRQAGGNEVWEPTEEDLKGWV